MKNLPDDHAIAWKLLAHRWHWLNWWTLINVCPLPLVSERGVDGSAFLTRLRPSGPAPWNLSLFHWGPAYFSPVAWPVKLIEDLMRSIISLVEAQGMRTTPHLPPFFSKKPTGFLEKKGAQFARQLWSLTIIIIFLCQPFRPRMQTALQTQNHYPLVANEGEHRSLKWW